MAAPPPLKFTVRGPEDLSLLSGPPFNGDPAPTIEKIPCSASKFSEDGTRLAVTTPDAVILYDTETGKEVIKIPAAGVSSTAFSPLGTYLQTFQKPQGQQKNLSLWDLKTGSVVFQQFQKIVTKATWDWLEECGFSEQTPDLCYMAENAEGEVLGAALRPGLFLFGSDAVRDPSNASKTEAEMRKTCTDVIFYAGGSVWALDWCPKRSGWPSHNEFLVIGAHPGHSPHHRLGERLQGKGLLQIWVIDLMPGKINVDSSLPTRGKAKGRGRGRGAAAQARENSPISDEEPEWNTLAVDTYTKSTGFNLKKGAREKARGRGGRGRGRGRGRKSEESETPESPPETLDAWIASSSAAPEETQAPPPSKSSSSSSSSSVLLPKMVLAIAHEGEVAWDAKWRPVSDEEALDERECMRLGFLAAVLGDGSVQVFDVPLPTMWEVNGAQQVECEPLVVQMNPIFCSTDLQSNGHQSIPLSAEWSTLAPHDMLLVGCHDGTVAIFRVFPYSTPLQESRPLLFFTADFMTLRSVAWAPAGCGSEAKHLIATAGHSGWIRFWDLRDPYQAVYELQISRGVVTCIDWVSDPRCMLITMDDGSVRLLALDKAATDTAVTGKPYSGTPTQGLASYYSSYYAMWGVHVSRQSGLVAYCGSDGNVLQFPLTERSLVKEGARYREPHYQCGVFAADSETGTMYIISQNLYAPRLKPGHQTGPEFRREFLARRNAVLKWVAGGAGFIPNGNPLDMEKPGNKKKKTEEHGPKPSKKSKTSTDEHEDSERNFHNIPPPGTEGAAVQSLPARVVAVQRLRWNGNKGKENWLAYGNAAGLVRCQYVLS